MALPRKVEFVTFDCYGTLIDWESGAYDAFQKEADRDGFTINRDELIPLFVEIQHEVQSGSYELYAEVLRRTAVRAAKELELGPRVLARPVPARQRALLADVPRDERAARAVREEVRDRDPVEHRRQAARRHAPPLPRRLRPGRHRAAGALLQAGRGPLQGVRAPDRAEEEDLGAHRVRIRDRRRAVHQAQDPRDLGEPPRRASSSRARRSPTRKSRPSATPASC